MAFYKGAASDTTIVCAIRTSVHTKRLCTSRIVFAVFVSTGGRQPTPRPPRFVRTG